MKVESITIKIESIFKQIKTLDNEEYEKVILNIQLLKKKYFSSKFKKESLSLFEMSFKNFIDSKNQSSFEF